MAFTRPTQAAAPQPAARAGRYGGIRAAKPKAPIPGPGSYRFKILGCSEGYNPGKSRSSFKISLEIVDSDTDLPAGTEVMIPFQTSGDGAQAGLSRVKSFVMAAAGFAEDEESMYDEFDPDGKFIEAQVGEQNEYSDQLLEGRLVDCFVRHGKEIVDRKTLQPTGQYYSEYTWRVVDDQ